MVMSNRVKRNISVPLTLLGCIIISARVIDPIMSGSIDGRGWFDIFGAVVITCLAYDNFKMYRDRVRNGIKSGS